MAIRTRDELFNAIKSRIGDDVSDEALALMEDVTDTLNDYETRVGEDWKSKYEENDNAWRTRYAQRFMDGTSSAGTEETVLEESDHTDLFEDEPLTYENLFKEE